MMPSDIDVGKKLALPPKGDEHTDLTDGQIQEGLARFLLRLPVADQRLMADDRFLRLAWGYIIDKKLYDPAYPRRWTDAGRHSARAWIREYLAGKVEAGQRVRV